MAESGGRSDLLRTGLARAKVLDLGGARGGGGGNDGQRNTVTGAEGNAAEVVGVCGVPLIPGVVGHGASRDLEVNTGLKDGGAAGIAVNADPGRGSLSATAAGGGRPRDGEGRGDSSPLGSIRDGLNHNAGPICTLQGIDIVRAIGLARNELRRGGPTNTASTLSETVLEALRRAGRSDGSGRQEGSRDGEELHDD